MELMTFNLDCILRGCQNKLKSAQVGFKNNISIILAHGKYQTIKYYSQVEITILEQLSRCLKDLYCFALFIS